MSRVTITRRHTGRFYVGLDTDAFFALYAAVLMIQTKTTFPLHQRLDAHEKRVIEAFKAFAEKLKNPPSHS